MTLMPPSCPSTTNTNFVFSNRIHHCRSSSPGRNFLRSRNSLYHSYTSTVSSNLLDGVSSCPNLHTTRASNSHFTCRSIPTAFSELPSSHNGANNQKTKRCVTFETQNRPLRFPARTVTYVNGSIPAYSTLPQPTRRSQCISWSVVSVASSSELSLDMSRIPSSDNHVSARCEQYCTASYPPSWVHENWLDSPSSFLAYRTTASNRSCHHQGSSLRHCLDCTYVQSPSSSTTYQNSSEVQAIGKQQNHKTLCVSHFTTPGVATMTPNLGNDSIYPHRIFKRQVDRAVVEPRMSQTCSDCSWHGSRSVPKPQLSSPLLHHTRLTTWDTSVAPSSRLQSTFKPPRGQAVTASFAASLFNPTLVNSDCSTPGNCTGLQNVDSSFNLRACEYEITTLCHRSRDGAWYPNDAKQKNTLQPVMQDYACESVATSPHSSNRAGSVRGSSLFCLQSEHAQCNPTTRSHHPFHSCMLGLTEVISSCEEPLDTVIEDRRTVEANNEGIPKRQFSTATITNAITETEHRTLLSQIDVEQFHGAVCDEEANGLVPAVATSSRCEHSTVTDVQAEEELLPCDLGLFPDGERSRELYSDQSLRCGAANCNMRRGLVRIAPYVVNPCTTVVPRIHGQDYNRGISELNVFFPSISTESKQDIISDELKNLVIGVDILQRIDHSAKFVDDVFEYRFVVLPLLHPFLELERSHRSAWERMLSEAEWRSLGIRQTRGWAHVGYSRNEANVLLFRRIRGTDPRTGEIPSGSETRVAERLSTIEVLEKCVEFLDAETLSPTDVAPTELAHERPLSDITAADGQPWSLPYVYSTLTRYSPTYVSLGSSKKTSSYSSTPFFDLPIDEGNQLMGSTSVIHQNQPRLPVVAEHSVAEQRAAFVKHIDRLSAKLHTPLYVI